MPTPPEEKDLREVRTEVYVNFGIAGVGFLVFLVGALLLVRGWRVTGTACALLGWIIGVGGMFRNLLVAIRSWKRDWRS